MVKLKNISLKSLVGLGMLLVKGVLVSLILWTVFNSCIISSCFFSFFVSCSSFSFSLLWGRKEGKFGKLLYYAYFGVFGRRDIEDSLKG